jgi:hypothetical protein
MRNPLGMVLTIAPLVLGGLPLSANGQEVVDKVTQVGEQRIVEGVAAQRQIDEVSTQAESLERQFNQVNKVVEGLAVYNGLLAEQVTSQQKEMQALTESVGKVALIERQIVPLMMRMITTLGEFVRLDLPFLPQERQPRVAGLQSMMARSEVGPAEKFRRIIEAYQIENDYGRTIEAYKGALELSGAKREVNFLRIGRVALLFQTDDGEQTGAWDAQSKSWTLLAPETYQREIANGLRIARKQTAPDLVVLPVSAPLGAQP